MMQRQPAPGVEEASSRAEQILADARRALVVMAAVIGLIWVLQLMNWLDHYWLSKQLGIVAHDTSRLPEIFAAPFMHWSFAHTEANSAPLFFLGFLAAYRGLGRFAAVSFVVVLASGFGSWLFGPTHAVAAGASGVVFGYFGYVVLRGIVERHVIDIVVGIVVAVSYWSILRRVLPSDPHISWQAHLFGLLGGVAAAVLFRRRRVAGAVRDEAGADDDQRPGSRDALHQELRTFGLD
jgi:membrane associated rhomboid family serine protease